MFNKVRANLRNTRTKFFNSMGGTGNDTGPLSFFTQWFNPNNLIGELQQLERYTGITYACISAIAEDVARIKFTINRTMADGTLEPVQSHPFLALLKNPNPTQSDFGFMEMTQTHIELTGEAFWYLPKGSITAKPKEAYLLRPDLVQVVFDQESGDVTGYIYHKWNGRVQVPLDLDEVIHFKMPNPINPYRGMGTVQAGIVYIQTEEYASRYSRNFLANNATPAGIVNFKGTIPDPEFQKVKRQWTREYGSVDNAGKTAFVRAGDVSYQKIGSDLQDIDLKALKNLTRDDIMFMFRVSKPILGITEDVNYSNAKTSEYIFAKRVIDPKMNRIVDTLQTFYNTKYKDGLVVSYTSPIPQDNDEKIAYYKAALNQWMTPNEIRAEEGLDDTPGGDVIRMPFNLRAIEEETAVDNNTTGAIPPEELVPPTKAVIRKRLVLHKTEVQPSGLAKTKEDFRVLLVNTSKAYRPQVKQAFTTEIAKMKHSVLNQIKDNGIKGLKKKDLTDDIDYGAGATAEGMTAASMPIFTELMQESGKYAAQLAGGDSYELTQASVERITERVGKVAGDYTARLQSDLVETLTNGLEQGLTLAELSKEVNDVFQSYLDWEAERLARTESMHEANYATLEAYEQNGVVQKEWYAGGPNPCEFCESLNGTIVDTKEVFVHKGTSIEGVDGGMFLADYQDIEAGDLHPNCECTIVPVAYGA